MMLFTGLDARLLNHGWISATKELGMKKSISGITKSVLIRALVKSIAPVTCSIKMLGFQTITTYHFVSLQTNISVTTLASLNKCVTFNIQWNQVIYCFQDGMLLFVFLCIKSIGFYDGWTRECMGTASVEASIGHTWWRASPIGPVFAPLCCKTWAYHICVLHSLGYVVQK